jgi:hypothetical protein
MTDPFDALNIASRNLYNAGQVEAQANKIENLSYAGEELSRILRDLMQANGQITCGISRSIITAALAKWERAKQGQQ